MGLSVGAIAPAGFALRFGVAGGRWVGPQGPLLVKGAD